MRGVCGCGGPGSLRGTVEMGSTCVQSLGRSERGREGWRRKEGGRDG